MKIEKTEVKSSMSNLNGKVFFPSILITFLILGFAVVVPEKSKSLATAGMKWVTYDMGWLVQIGGFGCFGFLLWLAFGKYGHVKLGDKDDKSEFSNSTYTFMMFTAGVGVSHRRTSVLSPSTTYVCGTRFYRIY